MRSVPRLSALFFEQQLIQSSIPEGTSASLVSCSYHSWYHPQSRKRPPFHYPSLWEWWQQEQNPYPTHIQNLPKSGQVAAQLKSEMLPELNRVKFPKKLQYPLLNLNHYPHFTNTEHTSKHIITNWNPVSLYAPVVSFWSLYILCRIQIFHIFKSDYREKRPLGQS